MAGVKERSGGKRAGAGPSKRNIKISQTAAYELRKLAAARGVTVEAYMESLIMMAANIASKSVVLHVDNQMN